MAIPDISEVDMERTRAVWRDIQCLPEPGRMLLERWHAETTPKPRLWATVVGLAASVPVLVGSVFAASALYRLLVWAAKLPWQW